jgi:Type II secretion system (T2SS), protein M subtype b
MESLPKFVRQIFAVALLGAAAALIWLFAVAPVMDSYDANQRALEEVRRAYAKSRSVADFEGKLGGLTKPEDAERLKRQVLPGDSDAISLAGLQSTLQTLSATNGAQVLSAQTLPAQDSKDFRMVGVRIDMAGDLAAIQHTLHKIETNEPFFFVTRATFRKRDGAPENAAYEPVILDVQLDVYGARELTPGVSSTQ